MDELLIKFEQDHNKNMMNFDNQRIFNQSISSDVFITNKKTNPAQISIKTASFPHPTIQILPALTDCFVSVKPDKYCLYAIMRQWLFGIPDKYKIYKIKSLST